MNFGIYAFISTVVLTGTILQTYIQQEHFYPTLLALSQEKVQLAVIYNFMLMLCIVFVRMVVSLFVGRLTPIESEQLVENGRSMIADTILFLIFYSPTINGREISTVTLVQFIALILVLKVFHSICQIRITRMFEVGIPSAMTLVRIGSLLVFLFSIDGQTVYQVSKILEKNSTFYTWLLFEFSNVSLTAISMGFRFGFNLIDLKISTNGWPAKSVYIFYTELITDIIQMTCYILFMGIFFYQNPSRLPIYAIADVIQVARQLANRLRSFKKYREITHNMDTRFLDATPAQTEAAESCIICRDKLGPGCKVLNCGHIFHSTCLKSWVVVQQTCPTCRSDLTAAPINTVVPTNAAETTPAKRTEDEVPEEGRAESVRTTSRERDQSPAEDHSLKPIMGSSNAPSLPSVSSTPRKTETKNRQLIEAIEHAEAMAEFYHNQAKLWSLEIQSSLSAILPSEPESLQALLDTWRVEVSEPAQPVVDSIDAMRKARQQKYEIRNSQS